MVTFSLGPTAQSQHLKIMLNLICLCFGVSLVVCFVVIVFVGFILAFGLSTYDCNHQFHEEKKSTLSRE